MVFLLFLPFFCPRPIIKRSSPLAMMTAVMKFLRVL
jgi:hypothetical protein